MVKYGISHTEAFLRVWCMVEAINCAEKFYVSYLNSSEEQEGIACKFEKASSVGFGICAGFAIVTKYTATHNDKRLQTVIHFIIEGVG